MRSRELRAIEEARAEDARRAREVAALTAVLSGRKPRASRSRGSSGDSGREFFAKNEDDDMTLSGMRRDFLAEKAREFDEICGYGESPIEQQWIGALLVDGNERCTHVLPRALHRLGVGARWVTGHVVLAKPRECFMWVVQPVLALHGRTVRADFGVLPMFEENDERFLVELDGHDFHEKTKEQVARDKARERLLVGAGWRVLRFSGSEVFKDVGRCVKDVESVVWTALVAEHNRRSA